VWEYTSGFHRNSSKQVKASCENPAGTASFDDFQHYLVVGLLATQGTCRRPAPNETAKLQTNDYNKKRPKWDIARASVVGQKTQQRHGKDRNRNNAWASILAQKKT